MNARKGFTLIEMLVVIGIIGILVAALVPLANKARSKAKEAAVKTQMSSIEAGLNSYAQNHGGNFPGVAVDVMAPYSDHALGDPALYTGSASNVYDASPGRVVAGVMGGFGHYNPSSSSAFEQLRDAKNLPIAGNTARARYFDVMMATDAMQEYPPNPFATTATGQRQSMRNIFRFAFDINGGFDPNNNFAPGATTPAAARYDVSLNVQAKGTGGVTIADGQDTTRLFFTQQPSGLPPGSFTPDGFSTYCLFGPGDDDYFAPGDFAYVPVMSSSPYVLGDSTATIEDETYKWGTQVNGYLLFGFGDRGKRNKELAAAQQEFFTTGMNGFGNPGVDTLYEYYALMCFEGAIYYSKQVN